ncbi:MAG: hypothetical protein FWD73_06475 [Polyangiaceae bacterium]|nr:hypothetical protein [Polyangiaceae bacterium]
MRFSIGELIALENERQAEQARLDRVLEQKEHQKRIEAEKQRRAEIEAEMRAREEAADRRRQNEIEAEARCDADADADAIEKASLKQASLEVEMRARAEEREREQRHEIELLQVKARNRPRPTSMGTLSCAILFGAALMLLAFVGVYFDAMKPATDRRIADLNERVAIAEKRAFERDRQIDDQARAMATIEMQRDEARAELHALKSGPAIKCPTTGGSSPPRPGPSSKPANSSPRPVCTCPVGDPMCSCL